MSDIFHSIVRVQAGNRLGCGFLAKGGYIITAGHVVKGVPSPEFRIVNLQSRGFDQVITAEQCLFKDISEGDFAIYQITDTVPDEARLLNVLDEVDTRSGASFQCYGFYNTVSKNGHPYNEGIIDAVNTPDEHNLPKLSLALTGPIQGGYSGSPIYDDTRKGVIGIILQADPGVAAIGRAMSYIVQTSDFWTFTPDSIQNNLNQMPTVSAQNLRDYIADAKIEKAIEAMKDLVKTVAKDWATFLNTQSQEYSQLKQDKMLGMIDFKEEGIRRSTVVKNLLDIINGMEKDGVFTQNHEDFGAGRATHTSSPSNSIDKQQLLSLINQNHVDEVIFQLDELFVQQPNARYSLIRQNIMHALSQGQAPNPSLIMGLRVFIRELN